MVIAALVEWLVSGRREERGRGEVGFSLELDVVVRMRSRERAGLGR